MSRKNIFEILSEDFDVAQEIKNIWDLFSNKIIIDDRIEYYGDKRERTILYCVDKYSFSNWQGRNRCVSSVDMMERLNISENNIKNIRKLNIELLIFLEFCCNMIKRCDVAIENGNAFYTNDYQILTENINSIVEHFGQEIYYDREKEQVLIIEKNEAATAAAEISEHDIAKKIIQYNHYTLKGDVESKKNIILLLANELEPLRSELEEINQTIASDIFFMLNNMNLRHNNIEPNDKNYKKYVAEMDKNELEEWYDEIYQMILLAKLLLDNVERQKKIKDLKKLVN